MDYFFFFFAVFLAAFFVAFFAVFFTAFLVVFLAAAFRTTFFAAFFFAGICDESLVNKFYSTADFSCKRTKGRECLLTTIITLAKN